VFALKGFKVVIKLFATLYKYKLFICFFEITYKFGQCLPALNENLLRIRFSVIGRFLQCQALVGCRENVPN
jgi:hypothetical protein